TFRVSFDVPGFSTFGELFVTGYLTDTNTYSIVGVTGYYVGTTFAHPVTGLRAGSDNKLYFDSHGAPASPESAYFDGVNHPTLLDTGLGFTTSTGTYSLFWDSTTYRLTDGVSNPVATDVTVEIMPEPASMTALALGGLALLRRRRA
ncbi:MAG: hypothetical protein ACOYON_03940, partial [Fimbriimonas sp.]